MTRSGGTLVLVALPGAPAPRSRPNTATRNRLQSLTVRKIEY